jgi:hypothetical protein
VAYTTRTLDADITSVLRRLLFACCFGGGSGGSSGPSTPWIACPASAGLRVGGELFLDTSSGQIVQVLEGPTRTVRELYAKIDRDLRHDHCTIISEEPIPAGTRRYPEWGMSQTDFAHLSAQLGGAACARAAALLQSWRDGETHATKGEREARARRRTSFSEAELTA